MDSSQARKAFEDLAIEEPEREVEPLEEGDDGAKIKTLADKSVEAPELSDMQSAIAKLFPEGLGDEIVNKLMIARVAPDVFMSLLKLLVTEEIRKSDPKTAISVASTVAKIYTVLSIGLDGKGRIDHIELTGASKETEDLEKLSKGLFG